MRLWVRVLVLLSPVLLSSACDRGVDNTRHAEAIAAIVGSTPQWVDADPLGKRLWTIERTFYDARHNLPAWINGVGTTPQLKDLFQQLHYSEKHGLEPARYHVAEFEQMR